MNNSELLERLGFLLDRGFSVVSFETYPDHFGDTVVKFQKDEVQLRVTRDRGQEFVDLRPAGHPEEWFDLSLVVQTLLSMDTTLELTELDTARPHLEAVLPKLEGAFSEERWSATSRQLKELELKRVKVMFPNA